MITQHDISLKIYDSSRLRRVIYNIHARMTDNAFLSRRHQDPVLDDVASFSRSLVTFTTGKNPDRIGGKG